MSAIPTLGKGKQEDQMIKAGAGEMVQEFRAIAAFWIPLPTLIWWLTITSNFISRDPVPASDL